MSGEPRWIVMRNFERFQHRDALRTGGIPWLKTYTALLSDEDYLGLSAGARAVLHGLWLEYARSRGRIRLVPASLTARLGLRVRLEHIEALIHAGFLELSASKPASNLASSSASQDKRREEETTLAKGRSGAPTSKSTEEIDTLGNPIELVGVTPLRRKVDDPRQRAGDKTSTYTGCRQTRGHGGFGYVHDTLGIDLPPADWPHKPPTAAEVARALEARRKIVHRDPGRSTRATPGTSGA